MTKSTTDNSVPLSSLFSSEDEQTMRNIMMKITAEGFVPRATLYEQFGDGQATKALAILHKSQRVIVESLEPWGNKKDKVLGFKLSTEGMSIARAKKLPPALAWLPELFKQQKKTYSEYQRIALRCRYLTPILGALPTMTDDETPQPILAFERNWAGEVIVQRFGVRAMLKQGLRLTNRSEYAAAYFGFETVVLSNVKMLPDKIRGGQNERGEAIGTTRSECAALGHEFIIAIRVPLTYITPNDFVELMRVCGSMVGLSPGRSAGYGDFEVLAVEPS